jgi:hypothetical protein
MSWIPIHTWFTPSLKQDYRRGPLRVTMQVTMVGALADESLWGERGELSQRLRNLKTRFL